MSPDFLARCNKLQELFEHAEKQIKLIQTLSIGVDIPAVTELRYVGNHVLKAISAKTPEEQDKYLDEAFENCRRAIYDAIESGILFLLGRIEKFITDYRFVTIPDLIPNYIAKKGMARKIRNQIDTIKDREKPEKSADAEKWFFELRDLSELFEDARQDLNKKISKRRRNLVFAILGIIIPIAAAVISVFVC